MSYSRKEKGKKKIRPTKKYAKSMPEKDEPEKVSKYVLGFWLIIAARRTGHGHPFYRLPREILGP